MEGGEAIVSENDCGEALCHGHRDGQEDTGLRSWLGGVVGGNRGN